MTRRPNYTIVQVKQAIELKSTGHRPAEIAEIIGLETATVQKVLCEVKKMSGVKK